MVVLAAELVERQKGLRIKVIGRQPDLFDPIS